MKLNKSVAVNSKEHIIQFKKLYEDWCGFELKGKTLEEVESEISRMIDFLTSEVNDNGVRLEKLAKNIFK